MPFTEDVKHMVERISGYRRPAAAAAKALTRARKAQTFAFNDDGETPNNPNWPLCYYRSALALSTAYDPAAIIETLFAAHGWTDSWRDSMYPYNHFHTRTHEVLGLARGNLVARFGGKRGRKLHLKAGDVVVLPAGTGHRRLSASRDLLVVGAYPADGTYDEPTPDEAPADARSRIAKVRRPKKDPVYGTNGPLLKIWRA